MQNSELQRRQFLTLTGAAVGSLALGFDKTLAQDSAKAIIQLKNESTTTTKKPSLKKGFCTVIDDTGKGLEKIKALQAKWLYSWNNNLPADLPEGVDFAPMMWGKLWDDAAESLARLKKLGEEKKIHYLMGFNEPDQHDQANMTVAEAIEAWPRLMEVGLPLTSPGCVHPDREWMKEFMAEVDKQKLRVDYVCVHSYGGPSATALLGRLKQVHEMFGKRPLWITEFAVGDWEAKTPEANRHSPAKIAEFMREVLPLLEKADFVHRYAWFSAGSKDSALHTSQLFDDDGKLTELGKIYRDF